MRFPGLLLVVCFPVGGWAQIGELVTPDDGSAVYFTSPLRLKGSGQSLYPVLFVADAGGVRLFATPTGADGITPAAIHAPDLSGDGSVMAWAYPSGVGDILRRSGIVRVAGAAKLSRNGRFALTSNPLSLIDLESGEQTPIDVQAAAGRRAVSADGAVALSDGEDLFVWRKGSGLTQYRGGDLAAAPSIDDLGLQVAYESTARGGGPARIALVNLGSGETRFLGYGKQPVFSGNGRSVLFLGGDSPQAYIACAHGSDVRQVTQAAEGVAEATLSGDGNVVYAATRTGRLLRIGVYTGETRELLRAEAP